MMSAGCQRVRPTCRSDVRVVASGDDAGVLEPLPILPWLASVAAHEDALEETAVGRGVLDRHQRGVARRDAAPVMDGLGVTGTPAQTAGTLI